MESAKTPHVKKAKKKQVKDESDRMRQAEKKRRRLEKALATSAAIRSELEKKKQQKKEEQQRIDEEGAAIAEAVALHVLLGEDSDDTPTIVLENEDNFGTWRHAANIELFMDSSRRNLKKCSFESVGLVPGSYQKECEWNHYGEMNQPFSSLTLEENFHLPYFEDEPWRHGYDDISAGLFAAQAVSALQIREDAHVDRVFFNRC